MLWGISPALDLLRLHASHGDKERNELNVLLVGGTDCRHVLQTVARRYRYERVKLNFYIVDACLEAVARQILFLLVAAQPENELGLAQKTRYFMELYGNTLVRPAVATYLTLCAKELVKMITNYEYMHSIMPFVHLELRYKERDYLENVFKYWSNGCKCQILESWDRRLRKSLGTRYDTKSGAFDWDLHMRYHTVGGSQVSNQEYQTFRLNGVAFTWLESEASKPNRTLICGITPVGEEFVHYGYLGDMSTGPYVTYGLLSEDKEILKKSHNGHDHRSTDVTERNLRQVFHELLHGTEYVHKSTNNLKLGSVVTKLGDFNVIPNVDETITGYSRRNFKCVDLEGVSVKFMSMKSLEFFVHKESYHELFDIVFFSSSHMKYFDSKVIDKVVKCGSLLVVENELFVLALREKDLEQYKLDVREKLQGIRKIELPFDVQRDCCAKFILKVENL